MNRKVWITGVGVLSPNGSGKKSFRQSLLNGVSGIKKVSSFDPSGLSCQIAGEVSIPENAFTGPEKKNLPRTAQLALQASREALEDAGLDPEKLSETERQKFGVLLGTGGGSIEFMEKHYQMYYGKGDFHPSLYVISASTPGGLSSEISIRYKLLGRSHVITTGCTSSTDAIGYAFREIQAGRLDRALTGGADAPITRGVFEGFTLMKILPTQWNHSPERGSRPFARDRSGFVPAEGGWMFVLEDAETAKKRGAIPYAEICGYGSSCEAFHAVRLSEDTQANSRAIVESVLESSIEQSTIDYVNLHGTSTQLNDRIETLIMKTYFKDRAGKIPMSSTKSMIGHPQGASGAAGLAATLLCMREDSLHPTINLEDPDPECSLDLVPTEARGHKIRYALCNTLGFGSKSSALVIRNGKLL